MNKVIRLFFAAFLMFFSIGNVKADDERKYCIYEGNWVSDIANVSVRIKRVSFIDDGNGKVLVKIDYFDDFPGVSKEKTIKNYNTDIAVAELADCPSHFCAEGYEKPGFGKFIDINGMWSKSDNGKCDGVIGALYKFDFSGSGSIGGNLVFDYIGNTGSVDYQPYSSMLTGCYNDVAVFKLLSKAYDLFKIAVPIIMVIFGMIDFAKAATSSDEGQIKKAQGHFVRRVIAGIIVLLSFVCVEFLIRLLPGSSEAMQCVKNFFK